MNKRALLNAVVRNVMTKIAAQQTKGAAAAAAPQTKPQAKPALDPKLGTYDDLTERGGILDLLQDKYGARPYFKKSEVPGNDLNYMSYRSPDGSNITGAYMFALNPTRGNTATETFNPDFRKNLRHNIADVAAGYMYPDGSRNYNAFKDAATRFGEYRQLQQQNQGTLNNSSQFAPWARDNAPQVYKKLMNAPKNNRNEALQLLKWQVNNRRNSGNGYV